MSTRGIELDLPDLPEVPISLGPVSGQAPAPRRSVAVRLWDALTTWLPLLLMAALALGTWWLVRNAPPVAGTAPVAEPRAAPDYTMSGFTLQRFGTDGQLRLQIEGDALRHLPQTLQVEIDEARILALSPEGRPTRATARQVFARDDGSRVDLSGLAQVSSVTASGQVAEVSSEALSLFPKEQRIRGERPVELRVGPHQLSAAGLDADQSSGILTLQAPIRGVFQP